MNGTVKFIYTKKTIKWLVYFAQVESTSYQDCLLIESGIIV